MDAPLTRDLAEMLRGMRRAERDVFGALEPAIRDAPLRPGDWSPKDHQAHLTAWKARQARRFAAAREGIEIPAIAEDETDELNAELHATRAGWTWNAVTDEADQVTEQLVAEILATDPQLILGSDRLLGGTYGNGAFHATTHFGWLLEAGIGVDPARVAAYVDEVVGQLRGSAMPRREIGNGLYNAACFHTLQANPDAARPLLREAFGLNPELVAWSKEDADLVSLRDELEALAAPG